MSNRGESLFPADLIADSSLSVRDVVIRDSRIVITFESGCEVAIPLSWSPRLANASGTEREAWIVEDPTTIHWAQADEDIHLATVLGLSEDDVYRRVVDLGPSPEPFRGDLRVADLTIDENDLSVEFLDGRTLSVPVWWFPTLAASSSGQKAAWLISDDLTTLIWRDPDEHIYLSSLLGVSESAVFEALHRHS